MVGRQFLGGGAAAGSGVLVSGVGVSFGYAGLGNALAATLIALARASIGAPPFLAGMHAVSLAFRVPPIKAWQIRYCRTMRFGK